MNEGKIVLPYDVPLLPVVNLRAGEIRCLYENGNLRYLKIDEEEIVLMIYPAVRNTEWETAIVQINDEKIELSDNSFEISYNAIYHLGDINYKAAISISGKENSSIHFTMFGEALNQFQTRRIGLCVHHPVNTGNELMVTVTRRDNSTYQSIFPYFISPHQPFFDVKSMIWKPVINYTVQLTFEGDVFETEDQRNWMDNSFKTYSPPLDRPSPFTVAKGQTIHQHILFAVREDQIVGNTVLPYQQHHEGKSQAGDQDELIGNLGFSQNLDPGGEDLDDTSDYPKLPLPSIGFCRMPGSSLLNDDQVVALKKIPFDHYRIEVDMSSPNWENEIDLAGIESEKLGVFLELIVFFSDQYKKETDLLMTQITKYAARIKSLLPLHIEHQVSPVFLIEHIYHIIKAACSSVKVGYGTNAFFAELNRDRPADFEYDFLSFTLNPQVHASDTRSIIETLGSQEKILESIRQFSSKPVHISPLTFQQRTNALPDPRLHTFFGAVWTLQSLRNLAKAGAITLYQTTGEAGILPGPVSAKNGVSPLYKILSGLKSFGASFVCTSEEKNFVSFSNKAGENLHFMIPMQYFRP